MHKDAALKDAALKDASLKDAALKDAALKDAALKDAALKDAALKDAALKDAALKDAALKAKTAFIDVGLTLNGFNGPGWMLSAASKALCFIMMTASASIAQLSSPCFFDLSAAARLFIAIRTWMS
jgi:uncharacterized protein YjbI with pentapeptide repeats